MKILVVGSGGREHTLVWKIAQSPLVEKIYVAPGNAGMEHIAECVNIQVEQLDALADFAEQNEIGLTVVGPEVPLTMGIVDTFEKRGLKAFGPKALGAQLEGSKAFSKEFMKKYEIPTAQYEIYSSEEDALAGLKRFSCPVVVKADGLAAGKGVIIAATMAEAEKAIREMMEDKKFGNAGERIVLEEFMEGHEASILAFVDGDSIVPMVSAQDHKRAYDNDEGLNTGGMGAVSPAFYYTPDVQAYAEKEIIEKTLMALKKESIDYRGVLYFGLMIQNGQAKVVEFNARFGDPETESVLMRLDSDLVEIMLACVEQRLAQQQIHWKEDAGVCVVIASGGYPGSYEKGKEIFGLPRDREDVVVFHAGTAKKDGKTVTNGGRVLVVSALGHNLETARTKAYEAVEKITFDKCFYRKDIGIKR